MIEIQAVAIPDEPIIGPVTPLPTKLRLDTSRVIIEVETVAASGAVVGVETYEVIVNSQTISEPQRATLTAAIRAVLELNGRIALS